jgi:phosphohistidine phosphatase SixA
MRWAGWRRRRLPRAWLCILVGIAAAAPGAPAAELEGRTLVEALQEGGYTIYFRHAQTDWGQADRVDTGDWTSCDPAEMRQLSSEGRAIARRIGEAIRALGVPVAKVLSSEYCRAWETARLLNLGPLTRTRDIMNMRIVDHVGGRDAVIRRAQRLLAQPAPEGANVVIVGHGNSCVLRPAPMSAKPAAASIPPRRQRARLRAGGPARA